VACGPATSDSTTTDAAQAKSAADVGGITTLEILAKKEGHLNVIALPRDWANYHFSMRSRPGMGSR
jgi:putative spermidine/putrescine transport system substrate-binding protein